MTIRLNPRLTSQVMARVDRGLVAGGAEVLHRARRLIQASGPSAPGQPPAERSGDLRRKLATGLRHEGEDSVLAIGAKDLEYDAYLEFGTSEMEPRPLIRPSVRQSRGAFRRAFEKEAQK